MRKEMLKENKKAVTEQRRSIRSPLLVLEVKGKYYNKIFIGYTENISRDGFFLTASQSLKVGDQFPVEFVLPDNTTKVTCICQVVWTRQFKSQSVNSTGVGVRFLNLDESQKKIIDDWIIQRESQRS